MYRITKLYNLTYIAQVLIVASLLFCSSASFAAEKAIELFKVEGNQRIEEATVISYLDIKTGDVLTQDIIDAALKNLYATGLFSDVALNQQGTTLVVTVKEKPLINEIRFEGNDELKTEDLQKEIQLKSRQVLTRTKVQEDVDRLKDLYRVSGYYAVVIDPKIIELDQNRVNLIFEIKEGKKTFISNIRFVGNKHYSNETLSDVVMSREEKWYRFWASDDKYDPDRLNYDKELLRKFYLEHGYADFRVEATTAELSPDQKDFFITMYIDEGDRYKVGNVTVTTTIKDLNVEPLQKTVTLEKGDWYNAKELENTVPKMTTELGNMQFAFVNIKPAVNRAKDKQVVDIEFAVGEGQKTFIENVNINGNTRTLDEVVRREMTLVEGDAYNEDRIKKSEQNIKNLGFFSNVKVTPQTGSAPNKTNLDVKVEEQSTGSMSFGVGYSTTDGVLSDLQLKEKNFLGKGQELGFTTTLAAKRREFDIGFMEPYFMKKNLSAGFDVFHMTQDLQSESSYDKQLDGGTIKFGYPLAEKWHQDVSYGYAANDIKNVKSSASSYIQAQEGTRITSSISQTSTFDSRDSKLEPTEGLITIIDTKLAGLGGNAQYYKLKLTSKYYYPIVDKWIFSLLGEAGLIQGWGGEAVRIDERFALGGDNLRGFDSYGVGPRDSSTNDALGGNKFWRGSAEVTFPSGLPEELGVRGHLFSDFGSLWSLDDSGATVQDKASIRAAAGTGFSWRSPFGLIKVNWAKPLKKEDFDQEQRFRISFDSKL